MRAVLALVAVLVLGCLGAAQARADAVVATAARLGSHDDVTRFVLDLSAPTAFHVVTLRDPWRVVVDFPSLDWRAAVPEHPAGIVISVIRARLGQAGSRLTLAATGPVEIQSAFVIPPRDGKGPRFLLDLQSGGTARADSGTLGVLRVPPEVAAVPAEAQGPAPVLSDDPPRISAAAAPSPPAPSSRLRPVVAMAAPAEAIRPDPRHRAAPGAGPRKPMVVIDPGHGGVDPGAIGLDGVYEKTLTLAVARQLKAALIATGRFRAALTRDDDSFIPLRGRVARARDLGADLFISLHANTIDDAEIHGLSVYSLSDTASDHEAGAMAASENRADALGGIDLSKASDQVASILIDLAQRNMKNQSRRFARILVHDMGGSGVALLPQPHREAGFAVLTSPEVPSVLIEMGYISNRGDLRDLTDPRYQKRLARAITHSVEGYFGTAPLIARS